MKKFLLKTLSLIMVFTMIIGFTTIAYAASNLHKINGAATESGGTLTYESRTTSTCYTIKADAEYYGSGSANGKYVTVVVKRGNIVVASGTIPLDGQQHELSSPTGQVAFSAATYTVTVTPMFYGAYGVSTYFYN